MGRPIFVEPYVRLSDVRIQRPETATSTAKSLGLLAALLAPLGRRALGVVGGHDLDALQRVVALLGLRDFKRRWGGGHSTHDVMLIS